MSHILWGVGLFALAALAFSNGQIIIGAFAIVASASALTLGIREITRKDHRD